MLQHGKQAECERYRNETCRDEMESTHRIAARREKDDEHHHRVHQRY